MAKHLRASLAVVALGMVAVGAYIALVWAPPDREMGDVQRIMYAHVPAMWMALLCCTFNLFACLAYLLKSSWKADAWGEATAEVGLMFGCIGLILGSLWGKPTWGVYWTWDPRLTTAAIMLVAYMGYLALRKFVEDPERRAVWSAVVGIVAFVDIPIVWFSVRWWKGLHQIQSTPKTVDPQMTFSLRWNSFAFLAVMIVFLWHRYRIARARQKLEVALPEALSPGVGAGAHASGLS
jgi:heme exporter protein C